MTEELKQKAINRIKETTPVLKDRSDIEIMAMCHIRVEDYIAGATENGIQWHDLRKDPNDLPKEEREVMVAFKNTTARGTEILTGFDFYLIEDEMWNSEDVIAWCEIPQFKE